MDGWITLDSDRSCDCCLNTWSWSWTSAHQELLKGTVADLQLLLRNKLFRLLKLGAGGNSPLCWPLRVSPKKLRQKKIIPLPQSSWASGRAKRKNQQDGEKREDEREQRRAAGFTASLLSVLLWVCVTGTQLVTQHAAGVSEVRGCGWSLPIH